MNVIDDIFNTVMETLDQDDIISIEATSIMNSFIINLGAVVARSDGTEVITDIARNVLETHKDFFTSAAAQAVVTLWDDSDAREAYTTLLTLMQFINIGELHSLSPRNIMASFKGDFVPLGNKLEQVYFD